VKYYVASSECNSAKNFLVIEVLAILLNCRWNNFKFDKANLKLFQRQFSKIANTSMTKKFFAELHSDEAQVQKDSEGEKEMIQS